MTDTEPIEGACGCTHIVTFVDGLDVGSEFGVIDGCFVGCLDGTAVGFLDVCSVGCTDGKLVGSMVGDTVGIVEGK